MWVQPQNALTCGSHVLGDGGADETRSLNILFQELLSLSFVNCFEVLFKFAVFVKEVFVEVN